MSLFTPINQKRLTNISVVRMKKKGTRYEIACYPNKVKAWREKLEKNIDEVLQTHDIFLNVSKGKLATKSDVFRDFDTEDFEKVLRHILDIGEIQFTEKERKVEQDNLFLDVAKIVSEKCINSETGRAFSVTMIEKMMKDCHINFQPKKNAKQQAPEVIKKLSSVERFKITIAMVEVLISFDPLLIDELSPTILNLVHQIIRQERNNEGVYEMVAVIAPGKYHELAFQLDKLAKNRSCIEIINSDRSAMESGHAKTSAKSKQLRKMPMFTAQDSIPELLPECFTPSNKVALVVDNKKETNEPSSSKADFEGNEAHEEEEYTPSITRGNRRKTRNKKNRNKNLL